MKAASRTQALAGTLNVSAANAGIALGAMLGSFGIASWGADRVGFVAAAVALLAALLVPAVTWLGVRKTQA
jgi:DHA1 family inner membrane transport protein